MLVMSKFEADLVRTRHYKYINDNILEPVEEQNLNGTRAKYSGASLLRMLTHNPLPCWGLRRIQNTHLNTTEKVKSSCEHVFHPRPETHRWDFRQQNSLSTSASLSKVRIGYWSSIQCSLRTVKDKHSDKQQTWLHFRVTVQPIVERKSVNLVYWTGSMSTRRDRGAARASASAYYRKTDSLGHKNV